MKYKFFESIRHGIFAVISVLSTTGYTTSAYKFFSPLVMMLIFIIMLIGGGVGSTSGGLKLQRVYLMFRGAGISIQKKLSPGSRVLTPHFYRPHGKTDIDNTLLKDTYSYAFLYFLFFLLTAFLLCLTAGAGISAAFFDAAALSSTVGISVGGIFGAHTNAATLTVGIVGMLIARLEINIIVIGICSAFIRNGAKNRAK